MITLEQRKASYKELIRQLVLLGVTDVSATNKDIIDPVAWALFRTFNDDGSLEDAVDSALTYSDGWGLCLQNGDHAGFEKLLREGMSHHLADAMQEAIDVEIEKQNFCKKHDDEEKRLDDKDRVFDMGKVN